LAASLVHCGPDGGWLVLDTRQPLPISLGIVLEYLAAG
jgi:hypothetical protein